MKDKIIWDMKLVKKNPVIQLEVNKEKRGKKKTYSNTKLWFGKKLPKYSLLVMVLYGFLEQANWIVLHQVLQYMLFLNLYDKKLILNPLGLLKGIGSALIY